MQPLVSICIPTYNRARYLKTTIESIICQPEFLSREVEIVVSDNASTDDTYEVCLEYEQYDNFHYNRNEVNVIDENFPIVLSKAHGKLRKLNNDTFVLKQGALAKLCAVVKEYIDEKPVIFFSNRDDMVRKVNFHDFVLEVSYWITWSPCFSIWEEDCKQIEDDTQACKLRLWQVEKTYQLAYNKDKVVIYNVEIGNVVTPKKKDISYGLYNIFYCNYMKLLEPYRINGTLTLNDVEYLQKDLLYNFFGDWIIKYELKNTDMKYSSEENLKDVLFEKYRTKSYWKEFEKIYNKKLLKEKIKSFMKRIIGKI